MPSPSPSPSPSSCAGVNDGHRSRPRTPQAVLQLPETSCCQSPAMHQLLQTSYSRRHVHASGSGYLEAYIHYNLYAPDTTADPLTHSPAHPLTRSRAHLLTRSRAHSLTLTRSTTHALTRSLAHSHALTRSRAHQLTRSPAHALTRSRAHQLTCSPAHPLTRAHKTLHAGSEDGPRTLTSPTRCDESAYVNPCSVHVLESGSGARISNTSGTVPRRQHRVCDANRNQLEQRRRVCLLVRPRQSEKRPGL